MFFCFTMKNMMSAVCLQAKKINNGKNGIMEA